MKKRINFTLTTQSFFFCKCFSHRMTSWPEYSHNKKSPALKKRISLCDGIRQKLLDVFYLLLYETLILFYH